MSTPGARHLRRHGRVLGAARVVDGGPSGDRLPPLHLLLVQEFVKHVQHRGVAPVAESEHLFFCQTHLRRRKKEEEGGRRRKKEAC
jgi:hypothetical protein